LENLKEKGYHRSQVRKILCDDVGGGGWGGVGCLRKVRDLNLKSEKNRDLKSNFGGWK